MQQAARHIIPYFHDLESFYKHIKVRPPLYKDFDIKEIGPKILKNYEFAATPFRHSFYCVALFLKGDISLNAGNHKIRLQTPSLYFRTPSQLVSWQKPEQKLQEYFIIFTEQFLAEHRLLADIIFDLPFFRLEKAIPFQIEDEEVELLRGFFQLILQEYRSHNTDKFPLIASYVHTLLLHVRRLYHKYTETVPIYAFQVHEHEHMLAENFRALIRKKIADGETNNRHFTVAHFAELLSTHPYHLNAVVKRQKEKTATAFIHEQILHEAQSLLNQTDMTGKEIAFRLGFADSSHFNNFFKKQTGGTPAGFRKEKTPQLLV
jgi:AraC family transcriptional activator of pobA